MSTVFIGRRNQRGHGIAGFFRSLFRSAVPILKEGARYVAHQGVRTGSNIIDDIIEGEDAKSSVKKRVKQMGNRAKKDGIRKVRRMIGHGRHSARYNKTRKKKRRKISVKRKDMRVKKKKRRRRQYVRCNGKKKNSSGSRRSTSNIENDYFF